MMLGRCAGGAVRLSDGLGPLLIAEGIETGLTLRPERNTRGKSSSSRVIL